MVDSSGRAVRGGGYRFVGRLGRLGRDGWAATRGRLLRGPLNEVD